MAGAPLVDVASSLHRPAAPAVADLVVALVVTAPPVPDRHSVAGRSRLPSPSSVFRQRVSGHLRERRELGDRVHPGGVEHGALLGGGGALGRG